MILLIVFISTIASVPAIVPYEFTSVEIENCESGTPATSSEASKVLECTGPSTKAYFLTNPTQIRIHSVTYATKDNAGKASVCKKITTSPDKYELDIKSTAKVVIYSDDSVTKAIIVNTDSNKCFEDLQIKEASIRSGYVHVETIACYKTENVKIITKKQGISDPLEFPKEGETTCFLQPTLLEPIEAEFKIGSEKLKAKLSAYPKRECPPCFNTETISKGDLDQLKSLHKNDLPVPLAQKL